MELGYNHMIKYIISGDTRVIRSLFSKFTSKTEYKKIRTFTYYIPAPPDRKNGYQEKEFDQIFNYLMDNDFDLVDIKTEACAGSKSAGMWLVCILGAKTNHACKFDLDIDYAQVAGQQETYIKIDPSIIHDS